MIPLLQKEEPGPEPTGAAKDRAVQPGGDKASSCPTLHPTPAASGPLAWEGGGWPQARLSTKSLPGKDRSSPGADGEPGPPERIRCFAAAPMLGCSCQRDDGRPPPAPSTASEVREQKCREGKPREMPSPHREPADRGSTEAHPSDSRTRVPQQARKPASF